MKITTTSTSSLPPVLAPQQEDGAQLGMFVVNRQNEPEPVAFDEIYRRVGALAYGLHGLVDISRITHKVINGMYSGMKTTELDELAAQTCAYMATTHPDYGKLAGRIAIDNLHKSTVSDVKKIASNLYNYVDENNRDSGLIAKETHDLMVLHHKRLNAEIRFERDFDFDYFGFKTLERSYLLRMYGQVAERPQHLFLRVALGIHGEIEAALETYHLMSQHFFVHATPTLFNAGLPRNQMSSCFLLQIKADSIEGIYDTLKDCSIISKNAGGIGLAVSKIRAAGSYIRGTNGVSNGIVPMLRVYDATARYVDQGGGKRKGSIAIYLEPWHADVFDFLDLRKNHGKEENRARDLFLALWIPDLFMKRVEANADWTLMCPNRCINLHNVHGDEFDALYIQYEREGKGKRTVPAQELWFAILQAQIETGTPYMLYKDACNKKSNQQNSGTISCSNLCTEIVQYTSPDEVAVCNLASIALPKFVIREKQQFNFNKLHQVTKVVVRNLNRVIDRNFYPVPEARRSNMRHRPIGLGVQGLADTFNLLKYPFESPEAFELNRTIFETMYHAACEASCELAQQHGPYESYPGSPTSRGSLQYDLWGTKPRSDLWDWDALKKNIAQHGLRNSLLLTTMPTASTASILGNTESFEPTTSNMYYRRCLGGEFIVVNPHLLDDLVNANLWTPEIKEKLIAHNGSVQNIAAIPPDIKILYKTAWEIKQKHIIDMAADRGPFICQSQSLNIHMINPSYAKLSAMHFYGWRSGLKTGSYYLRTQAAAEALKFTIDPRAVRAAEQLQVADKRQPELLDSGCTMCAA